MLSRSLFWLTLSLTFLLAASQAWSGHEGRAPGDEEHKRIANVQASYCTPLDESSLVALSKRDGVGAGVGAGVGVTLPQVGLSLGNITTKLGNINLTVTNVTIAVGNVEIEDISIGNISVIVSVPLPGASPVQAFSALTSAQSVATSTGTATSTVSSGTSTSAPATTTTVARRDRRDVTTVTATDTSVSASVSAGVSSNPINLDTGNVYTEIGNITIFVGHVNVSIGDITVKNITLGNIFVLVQVGQPDLTGLLSNVTGAVGGVLPALGGVV